jgi:hypothetical protein
MKRTPQWMLGFLFLVLAFAVSPPVTLGQSCSFNTVPRGRVCAKLGARCSPPTVGVGDVGECINESGQADTLACECQGAPTPSYNVTLTPLTPSDLDTGVATFTIRVIPFNGFTGKVDFTCAVSGPNKPAPSCATPPPANVTGPGSATSQLAVSVVSSTAQGAYDVTVRAVDGHGRPPDNGAQSSTVSVTRVRWTIGNSLRALGIVLLAFLVALALLGLWLSKRPAS